MPPRRCIQPAHGVQDGLLGVLPVPADPDRTPQPVLLLHTIAERQRWTAEGTAAPPTTCGSPPDDCSAIDDQAALGAQDLSQVQGVAAELLGGRWCSTENLPSC